MRTNSALEAACAQLAAQQDDPAYAYFQYSAPHGIAWRRKSDRSPFLMRVIGHWCGHEITKHVWHVYRDNAVRPMTYVELRAFHERKEFPA